MVYFFQASALFCTENEKFLPILANYSFFSCKHAPFFGVFLLGGGVPKLTNIRYGKIPQISEGHFIILNEICEKVLKNFDGTARKLIHLLIVQTGRSIKTAP